MVGFSADTQILTDYVILKDDDDPSVPIIFLSLLSSLMYAFMSATVLSLATCAVIPCRSHNCCLSWQQLPLIQVKP